MILIYFDFLKGLLLIDKHKYFNLNKFHQYEAIRKELYFYFEFLKICSVTCK